MNNKDLKSKYPYAYNEFEKYLRKNYSKEEYVRIKNIKSSNDILGYYIEFLQNKRLDYIKKNTDDKINRYFSLLNNELEPKNR